MSEDSSKTPDGEPLKKGLGPLVGVLYGFGVALLGVQIGVGVVMGLLLGLLGMSQATIGDWMNTIHGQFMFTMVVEIMMVAVIFIYLRRRHIRLREIGIDRPRFTYLAYVLFGTIGYFLMYIIVVSVVAALMPSLNLEQKQEIGFNNPTGTMQLAMVFISLVMLPPIAEEIVFRGFMFSGLRSKLTFVTAALITSVFFAIGHLQIGQDTPILWVAGIDTFVLSMALCYIREKTGSIWPAIGVHMLKNFVAFLLLYIIR